jgi:DNA-binding response OmpR family regulator
MQDPPQPVFCLLVEDNPLVGLDLADALDGRGYYVAGPFTLGREACDWLEQFTPDVAIVDLMLKDGRCTDVIRELRARAIPFLIHSGSSASQSPLRVEAAIPWLEKPVSLPVIEAALRKLLRPPGRAPSAIAPVADEAAEKLSCDPSGTSSVRSPGS